MVLLRHLHSTPSDDFIAALRELSIELSEKRGEGFAGLGVRDFVGFEAVHCVEGFFFYSLFDCNERSNTAIV